MQIEIPVVTRAWFDAEITEQDKFVLKTSLEVNGKEVKYDEYSFEGLIRSMIEHYSLPNGHISDDDMFILVAAINQAAAILANSLNLIVEKNGIPYEKA